ncbi:MAG: uroporphyrinogen decarboxylase family protein [bacterium]
MEMTSRERIEAALRHQEPDRPPIFEYVLLSPIADDLLNRRYAGDPDNWTILVRELGWERAVRQNAIDRLDLAQLLGHDMLYAIPNPLPEEASTDTETVREESSDDPVERLQRRNERRAESPSAPPDDSLRVYIDLKEEMQSRGIDLPILAPAYGHGVWTDVDLMQTMLLAPEVAHEHFSLATRDALASVEKYISLGIDQIGVGGDFAGNTPLISPKAYRDFIVPEVRKVSRRVHEAGLWAVNASDGNLWSVIDDFIVGCEVDGYLEIDMHAGMDMRRLKSFYGNRVTLYGNLDCGNILSFASVEEVKEHTRDCLTAGLGNGGHILTASNAITGSVPLQNYLAVVEAYCEMFGLPGLQLE